MALKDELLARFRSRPFTINGAKRELIQEARFLVRGAEYHKAVLELHKAQRLE